MARLTVERLEGRDLQSSGTLTGSLGHRDMTLVDISDGTSINLVVVSREANSVSVATGAGFGLSPQAPTSEGVVAGIASDGYAGLRSLASGASITDKEDGLDPSASVASTMDSIVGMSSAPAGVLSFIAPIGSNKGSLTAGIASDGFGRDDLHRFNVPYTYPDHASS